MICPRSHKWEGAKPGLKMQCPSHRTSLPSAWATLLLFASGRNCPSSSAQPAALRWGL